MKVKRPELGKIFILAGVLLAWVFEVQANQPATFAQCIGCHGQQGQGNSDMQSPAIAGLSQSYLTRQLNLFKSGVRGSAAADSHGQQMRAATQVLSEADIVQLSSYISTLSPPQLAAPIAGNFDKGKTLYNGNCGACHGSKGEGNAALNAPRLANQDVNYLVRQIAYFKSGIRGNNADDKFGRQMAMMANTVANDQAVLDVLSYLQQVNGGN